MCRQAFVAKESVDSSAFWDTRKGPVETRLLGYRVGARHHYCIEVGQLEQG